MAKKKELFPSGCCRRLLLSGFATFSEGALNKEGRRVIDLAAEETPKQQTWSEGQSIPIS